MTAKQKIFSILNRDELPNGFSLSDFSAARDLFNTIQMTGKGQTFTKNVKDFFEMNGADVSKTYIGWNIKF